MIPSAAPIPGRRRLLVAGILSLLALPNRARAQEAFPAELKQKVDQAVHAVLSEQGVPSASIAIVRDGRISYLQAYGDARLEPRRPARPELRYSVGSISKQFTATAVLMLQEARKLSLDDRVAKFLPGLTRANEVTIRQLLSHTSGYQDYWPQDYVPPFMLQPISTEKIMELWATKPLDFEPGAKWQYSNTNFVIAGAIVEKAAGMPLLRFLDERIFRPLGMKSITDVDQGRLSEPDPTGYIRYALGPLRIAPKEGKGWLFAAGELAMTAEDLARWDVSLLDHNLMSSSSYKDLETEIVLENGMGAQYGLGVGIASESGHRAIEHGGEVSGFTARNVVFPDDRAAVVVLANQDAASAPREIAEKITPLLFTLATPETARKLERAREIFKGLQQGKIDRSLFTDNANGYFSKDALKDFAASLAPLGTPHEFTQTNEELRGGMTLREYDVKFKKKTLRVWTYEMPDNRLEQYQVAPGK